MSEIHVDSLKNKAGTGAPDFPEGATVTGVVTANTFVGALTGNVTGNASGSSGSCTGNAAGLTGTPSITVQDVTAEYVSIGGTLTYDDVTQIDSVGIITAQQDVRVGRNFNVTGVSTFSGSIGNVTVGIATATKFDGPGNIPAGQTGTVTLAASDAGKHVAATGCLLYTSPSPRD